ncbi:bifunctional serine/threonine-protein kinase/universal stress protein [Piscinibacter terrae]|uniref:Serine/threonine protein kinase n=1 Tax=Piscinibacter terrae TaxID=2496871 RepID=A0A3N7J591_9BURK|nr:bifunctional serine/threonine-protein kinase/universal stress protein [Albitalea terrae]RQP25992.1 serine/threonine protein kinase [Albitalea terrae]
MATEGKPSKGPLEAGDVVDGFMLEERTHQGGMASLWRVKRLDGTDTMPLIMKVPRIKGGDDPTTIVGFEVEQMILPTLTGPHVPRFVANGDFTGQPYIVMERIAGPSLKARLDEAPIPVEDVRQIGCKVATALHDLHRQHVVHLDVKPSNIMFRDSGEAVLIDFGLSRHERLPDLLEEEFELPMGTAPYMSPEQVQFVRNDPRSDLFALGVMLYHLVTGERPFGNPTSVRGLRQRLYKDPEPVRTLRADCPPWLQEIILRCLEVNPAKRHQSAAQLAFDLQNPDQVVLTQRAERSSRRGTLKTMQRWFSSMGAEPAGDASITTQTSRSPIVLVAVDVAGAEAALLEAIQITVQRVMQTSPGARLACLAVMKVNRIGMDELTEKDGSSKHVNMLVQLKHWARPLVAALALPPDAAQDTRVTFHVIEAPDAATAIVEYARRNQVDHIVMGARSSSMLRRYLGSVSAQVVAESNCTVTVVRAPAVAED